MCATFIELAPGLARNRQSLRLFERAIASSPTLRGQQQDNQRVDVEDVAQAVAARRGLPRADEASTLLAAVGLLTVLRALHAWLAAPMDDELGELVAEEFRLLAAPFGRERAKPKQRTLRRRATRPAPRASASR
jgi:hypothetical protein